MWSVSIGVGTDNTEPRDPLLTQQFVEISINRISRIGAGLSERSVGWCWMVWPLGKMGSAATTVLVIVLATVSGCFSEPGLETFDVEPVPDGDNHTIDHYQLPKGKNYCDTRFSINCQLD